MGNYMEKRSSGLLQGFIGCRLQVKGMQDHTVGKAFAKLVPETIDRLHRNDCLAHPTRTAQYG